jgi:hypothetical protein
MTQVMTPTAIPISEVERQHRIWRQANLIKKVSDRWVGFGPFGVGIDTVLAFVPGAGVVYGIGAGGLLVYHAFQSKASPFTIARMVAYLAIDAGTDTVPLVGYAVDALFPGQLMAAKALQRDIEKRFGAPEDAPFKERMVKPKKGLFRRQVASDWL